MNINSRITLFLSLIVLLSSCKTKEYLAQIESLESELAVAEGSLDKYAEEINDMNMKLSTCNQDLENCNNTVKLKDDQINLLNGQVADLQKLRDMQMETVGDLTVLSQAANANISQTLAQMDKKDDYINMLQAAKNKADSMNLALAVNLKGVLADGLADEDIEISVEKTVVFVNLSDKMLYKSGSTRLTPRANEVLGKIAKIIESRPDLEVMVEGYTDNKSIKTDCYDDNWDLSVKRATAVVRTLQNDYSIDPNRLIAAGRGEYNAKASNETEEGRAANRRTRIVILPKLNQFYDLLNSNEVPE